MRLPHRRQFLHLAAGAAALAAPPLASAQSYPTRPVRVVTGAPAGLAPDIVARMTAHSASAKRNCSVSAAMATAATNAATACRW
jgi:tripartite-type tricarboxylate transporter receptor subunit TctC